MRQIILFAVFVCALQLASGYAYYRNPLMNKNFNRIDDKTCKTGGKMCKNCEELVNCINVGDDKFIEVGVKHCDNESKEFCNSALKDCSSAPNPECTDSGATDFTCHNTGVFPDPLDCRIYHMCVEPQHKLIPDSDDKVEDPIVHIGLKCDDKFGYNPVTTYCDEELTNNECPENGLIPIKCEELGKASELEETSIFYVCTDENDSLVPHMFMCPNGGKFDSEHSTCIRGTTSTPPPSDSTTVPTIPA